MGFYSYHHHIMYQFSLQDAMSWSGAAVATDFGDAGFSFMKFLTTFLGISMAGWMDTNLRDDSQLPLVLILCCCPCTFYPRMVPFIIFAAAAIATGTTSFEEYQYLHLSIILFGSLVVSLSLINDYKADSFKTLRGLGCKYQALRTSVQAGSPISFVFFLSAILFSNSSFLRTMQLDVLNIPMVGSK